MGFGQEPLLDIQRCVGGGDDIRLELIDAPGEERTVLAFSQQAAQPGTSCSATFESDGL
jgi:hypothetical protein